MDVADCDCGTPKLTTGSSRSAALLGGRIARVYREGQRRYAPDAISVSA
jgi:hypothetical protein